MLSLLCALLRVGGRIMIFLGATQLALALYIEIVGVNPLVVRKANATIDASRAIPSLLIGLLFAGLGTFLYVFASKVMEADKYRDEGKRLK